MSFGEVAPADVIAEVFSDFRTFCGLLTIRQKDAPPRTFDYEGWFEEQVEISRSSRARLASRQRSWRATCSMR